MLVVAIVSLACLVVIWLVYPASMGVASLFARPRHSTVDGVPPRVSVILATRESNAAIAERVANLRESAYPSDRLEIIVARDAARDRSRADQQIDVRQSTEGVRVIDGDEPGGKASSLNAAARLATGEIFVFADTAQRFAPDAISRLVDALCADDRLGAVSGALRIGSDGRIASPAELYWRLERWLRSREARVHSTVGVTGAIYAQRRESWKPLPAGLILDDVFNPMRLVLEGWRVGFCDLAVATDERRFVAEQEYARKVRTLTGNFQLCAWLPAILLPGRNPIWIQFVCHKLLRLLTPYLLVVAGVATLLALPSTVSRLVLPHLPDGSAPIVATIAALAIASPLASRRVRGALASAAALQMAVVHATVNGLRGRWDVWS